MRWCYMWVAIALVLWTPTAMADSMSEAVADELRAAFPGVQFYIEDGRLTRVYGSAFSMGATPAESADTFADGYTALFGLAPGDLFRQDGVEQPVMFDRQTGKYKFTLLRYEQVRGGVPVYGADLRLLVRNEPGCPLVLAAVNLRDVGDYAPDLGALPAGAEAMARAVVMAADPEIVQFDPAELVIWAGTDTRPAPPRLALTFVGDNGLPGTSEYRRYRYVADARSGKTLLRVNLIVFEDVVGNVSGMATDGLGADICHPETPQGMPYARVSVSGGNTAYTDFNGNFVIPHGGISPVTVNSPLAGLYFFVSGATQLSQTVTPPGPANFMHNAPNTVARDRDGVNAYIQANVARDFILAQNPAYPVISTQTNFTINVDLTSGYCPCNAWYDGSSINFCRAGSGCPSTAFDAVVQHEYGHHLVATGGSGQGAYGEGMSDCVAMLIADDPVLAYGFQGNCSAGIRTGANNLQYPCSGEIHYCGQLLSGCVWSTRNALLLNYPATYLEILSSLTVNSVLLHSGTEITPQITIDFLVLDDDDDDISNGTPHYTEIAAGFGAHNMNAPPLAPLSFVFPNGRPSMISPASGATIRVEVHPLSGQPLPGTGVLHYNTGGGWVSGAMTEVEPNVYDAVLPAAACTTTVRYYFSAMTTTGVTVFNPSGAPTTTHSAISGYGVANIFHDDFNTHLGWTVQNSSGLTDGAWERAIPAGGGDRGDPPTDYDGSGYCYVTDNADGNSDVDGGYTWLISPIFNLEGINARVTYALWYTNYVGDAPNSDTFVVAVSNNGGASWVTAQVHGPVTSSGWKVFSFMIGEYVTPTAFTRVRFEASDLGAGSIVEAGVDAYFLDRILCDPPFVVGDMNCDGNVDFDDIDPFVLALSGQSEYEAEFPDCHWLNGDCDGNGTVDFDDIDPFVALLAG